MELEAFHKMREEQIFFNSFLPAILFNELRKCNAVIQSKVSIFRF
jgi:hypothetical protein